MCVKKWDFYLKIGNWGFAKRSFHWQGRDNHVKTGWARPQIF